MEQAAFLVYADTLSPVGGFHEDFTKNWASLQGRG